MSTNAFSSCHSTFNEKDGFEVEEARPWATVRAIIDFQTSDLYMSSPEHWTPHAIYCNRSIKGHSLLDEKDASKVHHVNRCYIGSCSFQVIDGSLRNAQPQEGPQIEGAL